MSMGKVPVNSLTLYMLSTLHLECSHLHHPSYGGGETVVGIPQYGKHPSYSPPYPGMVTIFLATYFTHTTWFFLGLIVESSNYTFFITNSYLSISTSTSSNTCEPSFTNYYNDVLVLCRSWLINLYKVPHLLNFLRKVLLKFW